MYVEKRFYLLKILEYISMGNFLHAIDIKTYRETAKVTKPRNVKKFFF